MYTRNFETKGCCTKEQGIPIQSFDDTFSADAFIKSEKKERAVESERNKKVEISVKNECDTRGNSVSLDELLVLGLVLLLLADNDKKENILPIVLLSMLLL